jgi:putative phosphoesterase
MKRILVISDTHGDLDPALRAVEASRPLDGVIHLGDLLHDAGRLQAETGLTFRTVAGNNDAYLQAEESLLFSREGVRIFACHGHRFDLHPHHPRREWKRSFAAMLQEAGKHGAHCVLFGHTHVSFCKRREGMLVMNPGSLWTGERELTYGLLTLQDGRVKGKIHRLPGTPR